jgi:hypothetical protein
VASVPPSARRWIFLAVTLAFIGVLAAIHHHRSQRAALTPLPSLPAAFANRVPTRVLWAWEEPEDLHTLPPTIGVAYLAETYILTDRITVLPRRQPLLPAPGAPLIAVVRIETRPGFPHDFKDTPELRAAVAARLAAYGSRRDIRALQLDFDAAQSQQPFYRGVLEALRPQLPRSLPLSITALLSWCGPHSWLRALPIDEAVPMEFRMGGPRALAFTIGTRPHYAIPYPITEPLCRTSLGLSTDEPWPRSLSRLNPSTRVYLFAPRPWQPAELSAIATTPLTALAQTLALRERIQ